MRVSKLEEIVVCLLMNKMWLIEFKFCLIFIEKIDVIVLMICY